MTYALAEQSFDSSLIEYIDATVAFDSKQLLLIHQKSNKSRCIFATDEMSQIILSKNISIIIDTCYTNKNFTTDSGYVYSDIGRTTQMQSKIRGSRVGNKSCYRLISTNDWNRLASVDVNPLDNRISSSKYLYEISYYHKIIPKSIYPNTSNKDRKILADLAEYENSQFFAQNDREFAMFSNCVSSIRMRSFLISWLRNDSFDGYYAIVLSSLIDCFDGDGYYDFSSLNSISSSRSASAARSTNTVRSTSSASSVRVVHKGKSLNQLKNDHMRHYYQKFQGQSGLVTLMNIWNDYYSECVLGNNKISKWCKDNAILYHKFLRAVDLVKITTNICKMYDYTIKHQAINIYDELLYQTKVLLTTIYRDSLFNFVHMNNDYFYNRITFSNNKPILNMYTLQNATKYYQGRYSINIFNKSYPYIIGISNEIYTDSQNNTKGIIPLWIDIEPNMF
jgi:hypothetical protein